MEIRVWEGKYERVFAPILIELTDTIQRHFNIFLQNKISLSALSITILLLSGPKGHHAKMHRSTGSMVGAGKCQLYCGSMVQKVKSCASTFPDFIKSALENTHPHINGLVQAHPQRRENFEAWGLAQLRTWVQSLDPMFKKKKKQLDLPIIPALGSQRQEDPCGLMTVSVAYKVSSRPLRDPVMKKQST